MSGSFDLAVIGSGFGGSLLSMIARRLGLSVVLLERGRHPRMAIGESSTPLANLLLEELADRYDLPRVRPLSKWGTWQAHYPEVSCGLKRGFSFFHHELGEMAGSEHRQQDSRLLVAASPHDAIADTHWYRAEVDQLLMQEAQALGAEYVDEVALGSATREGDGWILSGRRRDEDVAFRARFLVDASGPGSFLSQALSLSTQPVPGYPATVALYSHFRNVGRFARNTTRESNAAGFPPDDAALHHVFRGGWMWVLRFANGVTSAGIAATRETGERLHLSGGEAGWQQLLEALPAVREQFAEAQPCASFRYASQLAFRSGEIAGTGWALLPSAAGFVDPLFSTGFPLTLLGISRLAGALESGPGSPKFAGALAEYARITDAELLATARMIAALYRTMGDFDLFRSVSLLYFAAASFAETARRLGRPELAGAFLLHDHPRFGAESERIFSLAREGMPADERAKLKTAIYRLIEDFDVAGLSLRPLDACYPVRAEDLYRGREKVGASAAEIDAMLERSGFFGAMVS